MKAATTTNFIVGLDFLYSFTSENVGGVRRDAKHVVKHIASTGSRRPQLSERGA